jgi:fatty acid desaturase
MDRKLLEKRSDVISLCITSLHIVAVMSLVYLNIIFPFHWWLTIIWTLVFGISMHGILHIMHETGHNHIFKHKSWNEMLGNWVLGPLFFTNFEVYKVRHWGHHTYIGVEGETKHAYFVNIKGINFFLFIIRSFLMIEAFRRFAHQFKDSNSKIKSQAKVNWMVRTIITQSIFMGSLLLCALLVTHNDIWRSIILFIISYASYMYALMNVTIIVSTLRAIAEHQINSDGSTTVGFAAIRNFRSNIFTRYVFGAYGFSEHLSHHRFPAVPYYNLPKVTKENSAQNAEFIPKPGYVSTLFKIILDK